MTSGSGPLPRRRYLGVVEDVLHAIALGDLTPGDRLPDERALAERCGVSRATVREALVALEVAGVVEVRPGAGCFVAASGLPRPAAPVLTVDAAPRQILQVRRLLEPEAASWCASRLTHHQLERLTALVDEAARRLEAPAQPGAGALTEDPFSECNNEFHREIARFSGNTVLADMIRQLTDPTRNPLWTLVDEIASRRPDVRAEQLAEHRSVLEAIAAGDAPAAADAMGLHLAAMSRRIFGVSRTAHVSRARPRTSRNH